MWKYTHVFQHFYDMNDFAHRQRNGTYTLFILLATSSSTTLVYWWPILNKEVYYMLAYRFFFIPNYPSIYSTVVLCSSLSLLSRILWHSWDELLFDFQVEANFLMEHHYNFVFQYYIFLICVYVWWGINWNH